MKLNWPMSGVHCDYVQELYTWVGPKIFGSKWTMGRSVFLSVCLPPYLRVCLSRYCRGLWFPYACLVASLSLSCGCLVSCFVMWLSCDCLVLSCLVLSCLVLSRLVSSRLVLSCLSCLVLSRLVLWLSCACACSCLSLSCLVLSCACLVLSLCL